MNSVTGYSIDHYGTMITGPVRMQAYAAALKAAITPGSIVLDIGAGSGIFSLLSCKYGASHVYAVEPDDAIHVARKIAEANGFTDRITFFQDVSTNIDLPEKANVIVSDLRGTLPIFERHIESISDARSRHLAPGGVLIPQQDTIWAGIVEAPDVYDQRLKPWSEDLFGLDFSSHRIAAVNVLHNELVTKEQLLVDPQQVISWDYMTVSEPNVGTNLEWRVGRTGTAHGISLWFATKLIDSIGFTTEPGQDRLAYGMGLFLLTKPVEVIEGDIIALELKCNLAGGNYIWQWNTTVFDRNSPDRIKAEFKQSSFENQFSSFEKLRKRASNYLPYINQEGEMIKQLLLKMDGKSSLEELAKSLAKDFPDEYPTWREAIGWVGNLSVKYSR